MKKLSVVCAAVAVLSGGSAVAGSLASATTGGTVFAVEQFSVATPKIKPGNITYSVTSTGGIVVNAGGKLYLTISLQNGATFDAAPSAGTVGGSLAELLSAAPPVINSVADGVLSADKRSVSFELTNNSGSTVTIGVGATLIYTPAASAIAGVKSALGTVGGTVSASAGLSSLAASATPADGGIAPADVDGPAASAVIAKSATALTAASGSVAGTKTKIDVVTKVNIEFTNGNPNGKTVALGQVKYTEALANRADGSTLYTLAGALGDTVGTLKVTVTPDSGKSFPLASKLTLARGNDDTLPCSTTYAASEVTIDATNKSSAIVLTLPAANEAVVGGDKAVNVCMIVDGIATITPITPVIASEVVSFADWAKTTSTGNGYFLDYGGAAVTTNTYWPGSFISSGYYGFLKITNTGGTDTALKVQFIDSRDGSLIGTACTLTLPAADYPGNVLKAKGSVMLRSDAVEASGCSPRVVGNNYSTAQITGQTANLRVQTFLQSGNGALAETSASLSSAN
jgi:hypothetical protein